MNRRAMVFAALLVGGTTAFVASAPAGPTGPDRSEEKLSRSASLTMADIPDRSPAAGSFDAAREARSRSDERMPAVPLPDGGNVNGIRWEEGGGTVHPAELEGVLEYNAACQWLRASRDGREADVARRILADVPAWPALRGTDSGAVWNQVVRELGRGGEVSAGVLADCDASHEREVAYAAERGRIPST